MNPQVSVIIPTYNRRAMVREAIAAVRAQRNADFELIVVDDGSTDGTMEMLREFDVVVTQSPHRGPAAARNIGVEHARAPLIAFLDSDDLWAPDKLARHLAFMRQHTDCVISQTNELWIRDGRRVNPRHRHQKRAGDIFIDSLRTCLISPSAVMLKTDLFRALGGFDEDFAAAEDYDLWLRLLIDQEVGLLDEPLVTRRAGHQDQLSSSIPAIDRFRVLALMKLLVGGRLSEVQGEAVVAVLREKCAILAQGARRRGRQKEHAHFESIFALSSRWRANPEESLHQALTAVRAMLHSSGTQAEACATTSPQ